MRYFSATDEPAADSFRVDALINRLALRRLLTLWTIVICTLTSTVLPQRIGFTLQTHETEAPLQEDTNTSEEANERLPNNSVRCKSKPARFFSHHDSLRSRQSRRPNSAYNSLKANHAGHCLPNGLRAPLVI